MKQQTLQLQLPGRKRMAGTCPIFLFVVMALVSSSAGGGGGLVSAFTLPLLHRIHSQQHYNPLKQQQNQQILQRHQQLEQQQQGNQQLQRQHQQSTFLYASSLDNENSYDEQDNNGEKTRATKKEKVIAKTTTKTFSRRQALTTAAAVTATSSFWFPQSSLAALPFLDAAATAAAATTTSAPLSQQPFQPAKRPTAYRVDSTIPPTLLPIPTARQQTSILTNLGKGSGTDKNAIVVDTINLNNMLNKAVFGTVDAVSSLLGPSAYDTNKETDANDAPTFVCFGVPKQTSPADVELVNSLSSLIIQPRRLQKDKTKKNTAIGLHFVPYSGQAALNEFMTAVAATELDETETAAFETLSASLNQLGVSFETLNLYQPLLKWARRQAATLDLVAIALELDDLQTVRTNGLQNVDPTRRSQYVIDPQGFIRSTSPANNPKFQLYTDRSLLKDYSPTTTSASSSSSVGNFFSERILVHEAAATAVAQYATSPAAMEATDQTGRAPLVIVVAPVADVRYLNGINGRIPRLVEYCYSTASNGAAATTSSSSVADTISDVFGGGGEGGTAAPPTTTDKNNKNKLKINNKGDNVVTTILLNPTAEETLSKTRYLRLEIGTGPQTLEYQTKIADYIWFSSSPKVNLIPRLMDG